MATLTPQDRTLHQQFSTYGRNAREWMRKCALLLPEIERRQIWKKKKFGSIYEYAAKLAGMSRTSVDDALRIMKKVEEVPALREIVESKGLNRVKPLVSVITKENQNFWVAKAKKMSRHTLETYIRNYRSEFRTGPETEPVNLTIALTLPRELAKELEEAQKQEGFNDELKKFLTGLKEKAKQKEPDSVKTSSRYIPTKIKRHVLQRTSGLCSFPGCRKPASSLHHTQRFALEKVHDPEKIQPLCTAHERIAHLGLIDKEECPPEQWEIREKPDKTNHKFYVDQFVALYRPT